MCTSHARPRRKWPAGHKEAVLHRSDNPQGAVGVCWWCGKRLTVKTMDIDHLIPFRDIADQACCGITNDLELGNLVPSCAKCNRGGLHEPDARWYYCGRTQWCCLVSALRFAAWWGVGLVMGLLLGLVLWLVWWHNM